MNTQLIVEELELSPEEMSWHNYELSAQALHISRQIDALMAKVKDEEVSVEIWVLVQKIEELMNDMWTGNIPN